ncbi:MAG: hypothetical protein LBH81_00735 [Rickettsiales bacterium]|jgi:hypothetical protein|nr:hypothetical protein [Rickettsiales bacterium]
MSKNRTKIITRFDSIQQTLRADLKQSLIKGETVRYDFAKRGVQKYNGFEVEYYAHNIVGLFEEAKKIFKMEKVGKLEDIYFRTVAPWLYNDKDAAFPFDHTPKYAMDKYGVFTVKLDGLIAPWFFMSNWKNLSEASREGIDDVASYLLSTQGLRAVIRGNMKEMKALGR